MNLIFREQKVVYDLGHQFEGTRDYASNLLWPQLLPHLARIMIGLKYVTFHEEESKASYHFA